MKNTDLLHDVKIVPAKGGSVWQTPGADAQLARLWRDGMPVRRIGIKMSEMFGRHISHNACVARAHRIDLGPHPAGRNGSEQWKHVKSNTRKARKALEPLPIPPPRVEDVARVQLVDLERGQCHFPVGDPRKPGFGYCGCDTGSKALDYCTGHYARMYVSRGE